MIAEKQNADGYRRQVFAKFVSFSEKSPLLLDVKATEQDGKEGLKVRIRDTDTELFYPWDQTVEPKSFIHAIKTDLEGHYPKLDQQAFDEHPISQSEILDYLERGFKVAEIPTVSRSPIELRHWRIDKVVVWRDIAILVDLETNEQFRYKLNTNLVLFLKKYRSGAFKTMTEAGDYFFERASLLNKIDPK